MTPSAAKTHSSAPLMSGSIWDAQRELEATAARRGVLRYQKLRDEAERRGEGATLKPAERFVRHWYEPLEHMLGEAVKKYAGGGRVGGAVGDELSLIAEVGSQRAAYITLSVMLSRAIVDRFDMAVVSVAYKVGSEVMNEINVDRLRAEKPELRREFKWRLQNYSRDAKKGVFKWSKRSLDEPVTGRKLAVRVGAFCIKHAVDVCAAGDYMTERFDPAWRVETVAKKARGHLKTAKVLRISPRVMDDIEDGHEIRKFLRPLHLPMVTLPMPWRHDDGKHLLEGGYHTNRVALVSKVSPVQRTLLAEADMPKVFDAIEALDGTARRINRRILEVQRKLYDQGGNVAGIPRRDKIKKPPHPAKYDALAPRNSRWANVPDDEKEAWFKDAEAVHDANAAEGSRRLSFEHFLESCDDVGKFERLYFPHRLDFRGRVYAVPSHLNHQKSDTIRGALEFADPVPVTDDGKRWQMIHLASSYGIDKVSYDDRVEWVNRHWDDIERSAIDPLGCEFWMRADDGDKAWQFLAACMGVVFDREHGERMGVKLDGSCNGMQHYACLAADQGLAEMVNLTPCDVPNDIYSVVCEHVRKAAVREASAGIDGAAPSIDYITRKTVKQPVMTTPYNVKPVGAFRQVLKALRENFSIDDDEAQVVGTYIASTIRRVGKQYFPAAVAYQVWLTDVAKAFCDHGVIAQWTSPFGFPVIQPYWNAGRSARVRTVFGQLAVTRRDMDVYSPHRAKQQQAMPPNYIHHIDAAHLMMVALRCQADGIQLATTHDGFDTHASHASALQRHLLESMRDLYVADPAQSLYEQCRTALGDSVPEPPVRGDLNLGDIPNCLYAFS